MYVGADASLKRWRTSGGLAIIPAPSNVLESGGASEVYILIPPIPNHLLFLQFPLLDIQVRQNLCPKSDRISEY
jgi:hypothetical protein